MCDFVLFLALRIFPPLLFISPLRLKVNVEQRLEKQIISF